MRIRKNLPPFRVFGEDLYGGAYYDTPALSNVLKGQSILAWEMNYKPLTPLHGAPVRLRVENQLGYQMVKWIKSIEFVESDKALLRRARICRIGRWNQGLEG
ncbi:MAG TPA: molybdopterin-dependent oxidoreductase [Planctomycetota bacterium]|nr:molybdopterin-dependent oxidoreductase [Planctomycetota bacterium]